ncbi:hypothetical protein LX16_3313 [Stackebrandtia albiflava]|uniref:Uncharacterized protein n=1 Tax=Stackebrandtia albiflava TaxID=406432 RepID=A0A562V3W4_9ACTN|nr:hypothetical protein [Stackebrandtia albiflava]TWJ12553.1 hypothetical protein LX16_3313 [Stackebrandtia albiflava]
MRTELWLILAFSAVVAAGILFMALRHLQSRSVAPPRPIDVRLQEALDEVKSSMGYASELMAELQREMDAQTAARDALVAQAEENRRLAEIDREQAERIRGILFAETKAEARRRKRAQWAFFLAGVLISIPVGIAINLLTN